MAEVIWYSVEIEGFPEAILTDISSDVLLCVEDVFDGVRSIQFGFYSHHEDAWYTQEANLICGEVTHWAEAPALPEID